MLWRAPFEAADRALQLWARAWDRSLRRPLVVQAMQETLRHAVSPAGLLERMLVGGPIEVGRTRWRTVFRQGAATLRCYEPESERRATLVIVYAMVNRPYILDLLPGRSVIEALTGAGVRTYLLDWGDPGPAEARLPLEAFSRDLLGEALEAACAAEEREQLPVLGYCQGGTLLLDYLLSGGSGVAGTILLATPIDFERLDLLSRLGSALQPESLVHPLSGTVPGHLLSGAFEALRPFDLPRRWLGFTGQLMSGGANRARREHFLAMERWTRDARDLPGRAWCGFIRRFYHHNELLERLPELQQPLLTVVGERDHLIPLESATAAHRLAGGSDKELIVGRCGHIGLSVSWRSLGEVWPRIVEWLGERQ